MQVNNFTNKFNELNNALDQGEIIQISLQGDLEHNPGPSTFFGKLQYRIIRFFKSVQNLFVCDDTLANIRIKNISEKAFEIYKQYSQNNEVKEIEINALISFLSKLKDKAKSEGTKDKVKISILKIQKLAKKAQIIKLNKTSTPLLVGAAALPTSPAPETTPSSQIQIPQAPLVASTIQAPQAPLPPPPPPPPGISSAKAPQKAEDVWKQNQENKLKRELLSRSSPDVFYRQKPIDSRLIEIYNEHLSSILHLLQDSDLKENTIKLLKKKEKEIKSQLEPQKELLRVDEHDFKHSLSLLTNTELTIVLSIYLDSIQNVQEHPFYQDENYKNLLEECLNKSQSLLSSESGVLFLTNKDKWVEFLNIRGSNLKAVLDLLKSRKEGKILEPEYKIQPYDKTKKTARPTHESQKNQAAQTSPQEPTQAAMKIDITNHTPLKHVNPENRVKTIKSELTEDEKERVLVLERLRKRRQGIDGGSPVNRKVSD